MALKPEHLVFIKKYLETGDHIEAYLLAVPKSDRKTAATNGKRWLKNAVIAAEILKKQEGDQQTTHKSVHEETRLSKHPGGRPTLYKDDYCEQVEKLCKLGAIDTEIADFFGIQVSTLNLWKTAHPEFLEALKRGKMEADANVADRLYQRAMGFEHDSEEIKVVSNGAGEGSSVERVPVRKIYPPDTTAAIYWLKNRQKDKWRDTKDVTTDGKPLPSSLPLIQQIEIVHTDQSKLNDSSADEEADEEPEADE